MFWISLLHIAVEINIEVRHLTLRVENPRFSDIAFSWYSFWFMEGYSDYLILKLYSKISREGRSGGGKGGSSCAFFPYHLNPSHPGAFLWHPNKLQLIYNNHVVVRNDFKIPLRPKIEKYCRRIGGGVVTGEAFHSMRECGKTGDE